MTFKEYWSRSASWALWLAGVLAAFAFLGFMAGAFAFGDTGWWDSKSFLVNIGSAAVGACFGIPLAVIVIGWFTVYNADRIELGKVRERTNFAWSEFKQSALRNTPPEVREHLVDDGLKAEEAFGELVDCLRGYAETRHSEDERIRRGGGGPAHNFEPLFAGIRRHHHELTMALIAIKKRAGEPSEDRRNWADLRLRWTWVSTEVRRLRAAQDLPWLPSDYELSIEDYIQGGSPLAQLDAQIEVYKKFDDAVMIVLFAAGVEHLNTSEALQLAGNIRFESLSTACKNTATRMNEFRGVVEAADADDWRSPATTS